MDAAGLDAVQFPAAGWSVIDRATVAAPASPALLLGRIDQIGVAGRRR